MDLYDCRTRAWFIEAATSPKDIVILVDYSGSMTGIRKEIARHVVGNILDTLGNNDYVNILSFNDHIREIEECFKDRLVQANLANVRTFKERMENITTKEIANFSAALNKAFELLQKVIFRSSHRRFDGFNFFFLFQYRGNESDDYVGAQCNQAIMLITDGVPYNFEEIFREFNWPDPDHHMGKKPQPVRVFTYLVGREVSRSLKTGRGTLPTESFKFLLGRGHTRREVDGLCESGLLRSFKHVGRSEGASFAVYSGDGSPLGPQQNESSHHMDSRLRRYNGDFIFLLFLRGPTFFWKNSGVLDTRDKIENFGA